MYGNHVYVVVIFAIALATVTVQGAARIGIAGRAMVEATEPV